MDLISSKEVRVSQQEVIEAIISLVFKKRSDLRPTGVDQSEVLPTVNFGFDFKNGFNAVVTLESKCEEVIKP